MVNTSWLTYLFSYCYLTFNFLLI